MYSAYKRHLMSVIKICFVSLRRELMVSSKGSKNAYWGDRDGRDF